MQLHSVAQRRVQGGQAVHAAGKAQAGTHNGHHWRKGGWVTRQLGDLWQEVEAQCGGGD